MKDEYQGEDESRTATPLNVLLERLHAQRMATWRPEALQVNIDQRALLVRTANPAGYVKLGAKVAPFSVTEAFGDTLDSTTLLASGPVVLVFFRFASCPACNLALPHYHRRLWPHLKALGASLLALSPQIPERLIGIKLRLEKDVLVACDRNNELARKFGILYSYDESSKRAARSHGSRIGDVTGTGTWELPMPTVIVLDAQGVVRFVDVSPDWLVRTEAEPVIAAVRELAFEEVRRPQFAFG